MGEKSVNESWQNEAINDIQMSKNYSSMLQVILWAHLDVSLNLILLKMS